MKPLIIFHSPCPDGMASAWVANMALRAEGKEPELFPTTYGDAPPDVMGREVYILDFSYTKNVLLEMKEKAISITVLDHHLSAQKELDDIRYKIVDNKEINIGFWESNLLVIFDMEKSGASLTWEYFYDKKEVPLLIKYCEDRDLWKWQLPMSREVNAAIASYPMTIESYDKISHMPLNSLYDEGSAILRYQNIEIDGLVKQSYIGKFGKNDEYEVPICNCLVKSMTSEVGNRLAKGYPFSVTWAVDNKGKYTYSLRSITGDKNPMGVDVSEVAKKFGGGGHRNASGCISEWQLHTKPVQS